MQVVGPAPSPSQLKEHSELTGGAYHHQALITKLIGHITGLAATAIGLGKETSNHTAELITPILTCLTGLLTLDKKTY